MNKSLFFLLLACSVPQALVVSAASRPGAAAIGTGIATATFGAAAIAAQRLYKKASKEARFNPTPANLKKAKRLKALAIGLGSAAAVSLIGGGALTGFQYKKMKQKQVDDALREAQERVPSGGNALNGGGGRRDDENSHNEQLSLYMLGTADAQSMMFTVNAREVLEALQVTPADVALFASFASQKKKVLMDALYRLSAKAGENLIRLCLQSADTPHNLLSAYNEILQVLLSDRVELSDGRLFDPLFAVVSQQATTEELVGTVVGELVQWYLHFGSTSGAGRKIRGVLETFIQEKKTAHIPITLSDVTKISIQRSVSLQKMFSALDVPLE